MSHESTGRHKVPVKLKGFEVPFGLINGKVKIDMRLPNFVHELQSIFLVDQNDMEPIEGLKGP